VSCGLELRSWSDDADVEEGVVSLERERTNGQVDQGEILNSSPPKDSPSSFLEKR